MYYLHYMEQEIHEVCDIIRAHLETCHHPVSSVREREWSEGMAYEMVAEPFKLVLYMGTDVLCHIMKVVRTDNAEELLDDAYFFFSPTKEQVVATALRLFNAAKSHHIRHKG